MRKKTIKFISDKLLWLLAMLIPLIFCVFVNLHYSETGSFITLIELFTDGSYGFSLAVDNIILHCLQDLFGFEGVLPLWGEDSFVPYFISYLSIIVLVQLAFDVLMFVPKLAHKWLHAWTQDEE